MVPFALAVPGAEFNVGLRLVSQLVDTSDDVTLPEGDVPPIVVVVLHGEPRPCAAEAVVRPCPTGKPELAAPVVELDKLEAEPVPAVPPKVLPGNALLPGTVALPASEPVVGAVLVESELLVEPGRFEVVPAPVEPDIPPACANTPVLASARPIAVNRIECRIRPPWVPIKDGPRRGTSVLRRA